MRRYRPELIIPLIAVIAVLQFPPPASTGSPPETPPKLALLVGINDYIGQVNDLGGTHNDVLRFKDLLTSEDFGFVEKRAGPAGDETPCGKQTADSPVRTLCSRQATRAGIIGAFREHLIEKARKYAEANEVPPDRGATVVFYYSGHGYHLPDDEEDEEPDGEDETIVPSDGEWDGENQIRDDEFNDLTGELRRWTNNITFIFDSCHSGTATRGTGAKSFRNPKTGKAENRAPAGSRGGGDARLRDGVTNFDPGYVTISGSLPDQLSYEYRFPDPSGGPDRLGGVLTYFIVEYLKQNPGGSYREMINFVRNGAQSIGMPQTPQAEGGIDKVVFGSTVKTGRKPIFPVCRGDECATVVRKKDENGKEVVFHRVKMNVGELSGAREGGIIAVYNEKARELAGDENRIGMGVITSADPFSSQADVVIDAPAVGRIPAQARIILVTPNLTDARRKLALDMSAPGERGLGKLAGLVRDGPYYEVVEKKELLATLGRGAATGRSGPAEWDIAVVRAPYGEFRAGLDRRSVRRAGGSKGEAPDDADEGFFISDRNGDPLYNFWIRAGAPDAAERLAEMLDRHARLSNLRLFGNEGSFISDKVDIEFVRVSDFRVKKFSSEGVPLECEATEYDKTRQLEDRSRTAPQISFAERRSDGVDGDAFYYRVTNRHDRKIYVYVYSLSSDGEIALLYPAPGISEALEPGETLRTDGENGCRALFYTRQGSDVGRETIKFVVSTQEFPAGMWVQKRIDNVGQRGIDSPMAGLVRRLTGRLEGTRGPETWGGAVDGWTAFNREVEVVP